MNLTPASKTSVAIVLLENGNGIRQVSRKTGLHRTTIANIRDRHGVIQPNCKCGKPVSHRGWCAVRFGASLPRQVFMAKWHDNLTCEACGDPRSFGSAKQCRRCYCNRHWRIKHPNRRRKLRTREDSYKSHNHARRAFYKWVCKQELYGTLYIDSEEWNGRIYERHYRMPAKYSYSGMGFSRGYPAFEAPRSEARRQWQDEALPHFRAKADREELEYVRQVQEEVEEKKWETAAKRLSRSTKFFRAMAGVSLPPVDGTESSR